MAVTQYIGSRYVPLFADPIDWDITRSYEPLTIVYYQGNSYTSKQAVPTGIDVTNTTYWAITGNYNAQIEQYRREVQTFDGRITANAQAIADEVTARMSEDTAIRALITNLTNDLESEESARETADTQIRTDFAAADTQIRKEFAAADTNIKKIFGATANPVNYGADPTGVNDSADAINDCISANLGKTIVFTPGTYKIIKPIQTPFNPSDRVSIDFNGSTIKYEGAQSVRAALMVGYSDNPTESDIENVDFNSSSNAQSCYKNFKIVTNSACDFAIQTQNRYLNARFINFYVVTQTNGINIANSDYTRRPTDCLISHGYLMCSNFTNPGTGITINGSDNNFEVIRSYGFLKHFDINVDGNWFTTIHTLGLSESSESRNNGISFNVSGTNWFNDIYNDAVKTAFYVNDQDARLYIDTYMDYTYTDIVGRTCIDCSALTKAPNYISLYHANIWVMNTKYIGIRLNVSSNDAATLNKINIDDVVICDNKFKDTQLAFDDIIRMGIKTGSMNNTGAYTGFKPLGVLLFTDIYKSSAFIVSLSGNKTVLVKAIIDENGTITLDTGKIIDSSVAMTLGFKRINVATTGNSAYAFLFGASQAGAVSINNIAGQGATILPAFGNSVASNYDLGTFEPEVQVTI